MFYFKAWDRSCSNRSEEYSTSERRLLSFMDQNYATELSQVGAYSDKMKIRTLISCFTCGLNFDVEEIKRLSEEYFINFLKASWFFHVKSHPWCTFIQKQGSKYEYPFHYITLIQHSR